MENPLMPRKTTTTETAAPVIDEASPNLTLWNAVQATDPAYTKSFSRSGGFRGTAISHPYQQKRATEQFGPKGLGWGTVVLDERYAEGAPIIHPQHGVIGREVIHVLRVELWYELNGKRGAVQAFGQTTFVGSNKHGTFTDEEAPKKSLTDAESKALASLGFSADVHLGLFDDSKYVNDLSARVAEAEKPKGPTLEELVAAVESATTLDELRAAGQKAASLSPDDRAKLKPVYTAKQESLK
jgi:hypothetical protein